MALRALANGCGRRLNQTACRSSIYVSSAATGWTRPQWSASEHRSYSSGADNGSAEPDHAGSTTHFGFTTVDTSQKEGLVKDVFSRVASKWVIALVHIPASRLTSSAQVRLDERRHVRRTTPRVEG